MLMVFFAAALATAVPPGGAVMPVYTKDAAPAAQTTHGDFDKVVCKSEETTGSRLQTIHVCMTKAQWEERSASQRRVFDDMTRLQIPPR